MRVASTSAALAPWSSIVERRLAPTMWFTRAWTSHAAHGVGAARWCGWMRMRQRVNRLAARASSSMGEH